MKRLTDVLATPTSQNDGDKSNYIFWITSLIINLWFIKTFCIYVVLIFLTIRDLYLLVLLTCGTLYTMATNNYRFKKSTKLLRMSAHKDDINIVNVYVN